jgi:glycine/D-amino acid oxidase-like deaminating enzyme
MENTRTGESGVNVFDVVVIGGGICGISTSSYLSQLDKKVLVIERESVGAPTQASSINSGILESFSAIDWSLNPEMILSSASATSSSSLEDVLCAGTMSIYSKLPKVEFNHCGLMQVLENQEQFTWALNKGYPLLRHIPNHWMSNKMEISTTSISSWLRETSLALGLSGLIINPSELKLIEPHFSSNLKGAIYFPNCASAHPRKVSLLCCR